MTFKKCSILGKLYGYVTDENGSEIDDPKVNSSMIDLVYEEIFSLKEIRHD